VSDRFEVIVRGARELEAAFADIAVKVDPALGRALTALAKPIKDEAAALARSWGDGGPGQQTTASGFRVRRSKLTVRVEQGLAKTTGYHPNYGAIEMRHFLIPARSRHTAQIDAGMAALVETLTKDF
jgi:hypothetical protein